MLIADGMEFSSKQELSLQFGHLVTDAVISRGSAGMRLFLAGRGDVDVVLDQVEVEWLRETLLAAAAACASGEHRFCGTLLSPQTAESPGDSAHAVIAIVAAPRAVGLSIDTTDTGAAEAWMDATSAHRLCDALVPRT